MGAIKAWAQQKMMGADDSPLETGYRWYHGIRTAKLAIQLAEAMHLEVDKNILEIGGLLHDIGKAGYKGPDPHGPRGARKIREEAAHLFSQDKLERVTAIVEKHYQRPKSKYWRDKETPDFPPEILLVQDADIIDHLGANAIWLAFHYSTHESRNQEAAIRRFYEVDPPWYKEISASLNYEVSQQELEYRLSFTKRFYEQWQQEERGELTFRI